MCWLRKCSKPHGSKGSKTGSLKPKELSRYAWSILWRSWDTTFLFRSLPVNT